MASTLPATSESMLAVVKSGPSPAGLRLSRVPIRSTPSGYARVRVGSVGICGTDIHIAADEYPSEPPVVMGHEIVGLVDAVGSAGDDRWIGTTVVCETYFSACENCDQCRAGRRNLCDRRRSLGSYEDGGFAEFVVVPVMNLHALPARTPAASGVLCEPLACVAHCLLSPPVVTAGDRVLVIGPGAMGQLSAQVARAQGGQVTLSGLERDAHRLAVAASLGIAVSTEDVDTDHYDVVIECSGSAAGAAAALRAVKKSGRYVQVGIFGREVNLPFDSVLYKELTVTSGFASTPWSWRDALRLLDQGLVDLDPLVTDRFALADFDAALQMARLGTGIKVVIAP